MNKLKHNWKKNKYNAKATIVDGFRFDSKAEANYYKLLKIREEEGTIIEIFRQVPIHLTPEDTYRVDFLVFYANGTCEAIEVKGYETAEWKKKKKQLERLRPNIILRIVK